VRARAPRGTNKEAAEAGRNSIEHMLHVPQELADQDKASKMRAGIPGFQGLDRFGRFRRNAEIIEKCYDPAKADALFSVFRRQGTKFVPTLTAGYRNLTFTTSDRALEERKEYAPAYVREWWQPDRNIHLRTRSEDHSAGQATIHRLLGRLLRDLKAAGVPNMTGSDMGGNPHCFAGWGVHDELWLLVEAGLAPMDAIVAATSSLAKYLKACDRLGSVEPGKLADFVILSTNPLKDIRNTERIVGIVYNGRFLPRERLDTRMAELNEAVEKRL
jgi:imidazolonepropionase-like amidohydrolase